MILSATRLPGRNADAPPAPDLAFAARPRLHRLRDALAGFRPPTRSRWGEPAVFFFDSARQADLEAARPATPGPPSALAGLIAAELPSLVGSVEVRRAARAVRGLREAAAAVAPHVPAAKDLADLLAVPDDEVVLVLDPLRRSGFRVLVRGVADAAQFQFLLLDAVADPAGPRPPSRLVAAYRDADPHVPAGVPLVAEPRYQLFRPSAVRPDGSLPAGFRGSDHWLWPQQPLASVPRIDGEWVVLLGEPAIRTTWEVERRFPALAAELRLTQVLNPFQVAERLGRLAGHPVPVRAGRTDEALTRAA